MSLLLPQHNYANSNSATPIEQSISLPRVPKSKKKKKKRKKRKYKKHHPKASKDYNKTMDALAATLAILAILFALGGLALMFLGFFGLALPLLCILGTIAIFVAAPLIPVPWILHSGIETHGIRELLIASTIIVPSVWFLGGLALFIVGLIFIFPFMWHIGLALWITIAVIGIIIGLIFLIMQS
ncbi:MAG: hypothetical protein GY810_06780 [Aureispira sp.]|nr:hypothetical protein [Aureispira sp.]